MIEDGRELCGIFCGASKKKQIPRLARDDRLSRVEGQGGVALFQGAELLEAADWGRQGKRFAVFGDHHAGFAEEWRFSEGLQDGVVVAFVGVGRIEKNEIERSGIRSGVGGLECGNGG